MCGVCVRVLVYKEQHRIFFHGKMVKLNETSTRTKELETTFVDFVISEIADRTTKGYIFVRSLRSLLSLGERDPGANLS